MRMISAVMEIVASVLGDRMTGSASPSPVTADSSALLGMTIRKQRCEETRIPFGNDNKKESAKQVSGRAMAQEGRV